MQIVRESKGIFGLNFKQTTSETRCVIWKVFICYFFIYIRSTDVYILAVFFSHGPILSLGGIMSLKTIFDEHE